MTAFATIPDHWPPDHEPEPCRCHHCGDGAVEVVDRQPLCPDCAFAVRHLHGWTTGLMRQGDDHVPGNPHPDVPASERRYHGRGVD